MNKIREVNYDVCIVSRYNPWEGGGLENVVKYQIKSFYSKGRKIILLFRSKRKIEKIPAEIRYSVIVDRLSWLSGAFADIFYAIPTYLKLLKINAKVILDNFDFPFLYKLFGGRSLLIKVHHGTPKYLEKYYGLKKVFAKLYAFFLGVLYSYSSRIVDLNIAVSSKVKTELVKYYHVTPEKIIVIHNGVSTERFKPRDKIFARKVFNLPLDKKIVLFVGGDLDRKGFKEALQSVEFLRKEFKDLFFLVVTRAKRVIAHANHVKILKDVPEDLMPLVYNASDILLLPSKYEASLPLTVLEALASGCPAVVSQNAAEEKYNGQGYIIAHNYGEFINYLRILLKNVNYREEMGLRGRNLIVSEYSLKNFDKYVEVVDRLIKRK